MGSHRTLPGELDAVVIGAGFGGLRMLYECRKRGLNARVFDSAAGVAGTWYWNRYPGARTDSESWVYIFTFLEQIGMEWTWKERFPQQPEVEEYLNKVADFLDLRKDITLSTNIVAARRNEAENVWVVKTQHGEQVKARYLISAVGPLATPIDPPFPGLESYKGEWYHTGRWPDRKVDFTGKRVAIIGTGATGVQLVPVIAYNAKQLTVFQRTPNYVMPARNHPLSAEQSAEIVRSSEAIFARARSSGSGMDIVDSRLTYEETNSDPRLVQRMLEGGWAKGGFRFVSETFCDAMINPEANEAVSDFVRQKIRAIVKDQKTGELLCPDYPIGSKRPPCGHYYFEAFNRPNVELVDISSDPIRGITPTGLKTENTEHEFDIIIFAIGALMAITGTLGKIDIRSTDGRSIGEVLKESAASNYGVTLPRFPNFFMIAGPQSPFGNIPLVNDVTVDYIGRMIEHIRATGNDRCESTQEGATAWSDLVNLVLNSTVIAQSSKATRAWLVGANVDGKEKAPLFFLGGIPTYIAALDKEEKDGWPGHIFTAGHVGVQ